MFSRQTVVILGFKNKVIESTANLSIDTTNGRAEKVDLEQISRRVDSFITYDNCDSVMVVLGEQMTGYFTCPEKAAKWVERNF
ncbi:hypothetical protein VCHA53O466_320024 [Vibrio chagasii]|nr:hypothetical protein VCHA53O466_320024 [Vibrio chagasii]